MSRSVWTAPFTLRIGEHRISLRADTDALTDALRAALHRHVDDSAPGTTTYSVRLSQDRMHFLYWGGCSAVRTRDPRRLLEGLLSHVGGHGPRPVGTHRLPALVLVHGGRAVLAPDGWRSELARLEPHLHRLGVATFDGPWTDVDLTVGEVVISRPAITLDSSAVPALVALAPATPRRDPTVPPGRYPVRGWALWGEGGPEEVTHTDGFMALAAESRFHLDPGEPPPLPALASMLAGVRLVRASTDSPQAMAGIIEELFTT